MNRTPLAVALALGLLLTAGCGGETTSRSEDGQDRDRARAAAERSPSPTPPLATPPATTRPTASPVKPVKPRERRTIATMPPPSKPRGNALTIEQSPDAHLIGAGALGTGWSVARTGGESGRMASGCQRATLHDIGATETRMRDFAHDDLAGNRRGAVQTVSRFGDAKSAWRAERVFLAWREECADELRRRDAALGTVRHGAWLSMVEVTGVTRPQRLLGTALDAVDTTF